MTGLSVALAIFAIVFAEAEFERIDQWLDRRCSAYRYARERWHRTTTAWSNFARRNSRN